MRATRSSSRPVVRSARVSARRQGTLSAAQLKPVALAVLLGLGGAGGQAADLRVPVPALDGVFVSRGDGRISSSAADLAAGRLVVDQSTNRAIYRWDSFNIGKDASATFNMPSSTSSALNRVVGSTLKPSEILGKLNSNGNVYIVNRNGIIFGANAQVNVGGLVASTLEVDDDDYVAGFTKSIVGNSPTFFWKDQTGLASYDHPDNYVLVKQGAEINTSSGGRVMLVARKVTNQGTIRTPGGQTILAAGEKVYLADPSNELLYAIESNSQIPATRGLLVEVSGNVGEATNDQTGVIETARGNTTIVGMAVNQLGRISATSSVSENGTVFLQARGNATTSLGTNNQGQDITTKRAQTGGVLTLGAGSRIEIGVDTQLNADGSVPTADGNTVFKASRVDLSGQIIEFKDNAQIVAPGAIVNVSALDKPQYTDFNAPAATNPISGSASLDSESGAARVILGSGASINVAGTTGTQVSVARNFATTELIGANDLKDAPLQKDGPIYRSKLTLDLREDSNILSSDSMSSLRNSVQRSAQELMSAGGKVTIASSGAVVTHQSSSVDVSGGQVTYTSATVNPSVLVAANGTRYTLNNAPKDLKYVAIEGQGTTSTRPGASGGVVSDAQQGRTEAGYVEGRDAGSITIVAPRVVLDGSVRGQTVVGQRQALGKDALAKTGRLQIGTRTSGGANGSFGSENFLSAVTGNLVVSASGQTLGDDFWQAAEQADTHGDSRVSAAMLNASGMGTLEFTSEGGITLADGANLQLAKGGTVDWAARGAGGITLGGDIRSSGGTVSMQTNEIGAAHTSYEGNGTGFGAITLKAGRQIDVSGNWVNQVTDGKASAAALKGGSVTLKSAHGLQLEAGSGINVSGGATLLRSDGSVKGTDAGSIKLSANGAYTVLAAGSDVLDAVALQASLQGYSMTKGGSLSLFTGGDVRIHAPDGTGALTVGDQAALSLSTDFFNQGGFASFNVGAYDHLTVAAGAQVAPLTTSWRVAQTARDTVSGASAAGAMAQTVLAAAQRAPVQLTFTATGTKAAYRYDGELHVEQGALIDAGAKGAVTLQGGTSLVLDGAVKAAGGAVTLSLDKTYGDQVVPFKGELRVGTAGTIDVSGAALIKPSTAGLRQGDVLNGGTIALSLGKGNAGLTTIEVQQGAQLSADGGLGQLDITSTGGTFGPTVVRQDVASQGGTISIAAGMGGAVLAGDMHARAKNESALGGTLNLAVNRGDGGSDGGLFVQQGALTAAQQDPAQVALGSMSVSATSLNNGFASVTLKSDKRIHFNGDVTLNMRRQLDLDAPIVSADAGATVNATGASVARMGYSSTSASTAAAAQGGSATLNLNGGLVELYGKQSLQGVGQFNATAGSELRLASSNTGVAAGLAADADITLKAPQVYVTTATNYTVDAAGHTVKVTGGNRAASVPLSAGGNLTVNAARIVQDGVLRVPFGRITFNASELIDLTPGSVTSVSGSGITVPYGTTTSGGTKWTYDGTNELSLPGKEITLNAPDQTVTVGSGATLDLSGGGSVVAYEFTPGPGGSTDIFTGSDGAFAVVPAVGAYAPQDLMIGSGNAGAQITFGAGGMIPAGTYAILPARYALLPGAFLVKAVSSSTSASLSGVVTRADGSQIMAGQLGYAGVSGLATQPTSYRVMTSEQAKRFSDIRVTSADSYLTTKASSSDSAVARRPSDAGTFTLNAGSAQLNGQVLFTVPTGGRGGEFNVAANRIRVTDDTTVESGVLKLSAAQIKAVGADSVLLGGTRSTDDSGAADRVVTVSASEVSVDASATPLVGNDLVLAATNSVTVSDGARIEANASASGAAQSLAFTGNGALLRVSSDSTARSTRTGADGTGAGTLTIGAGAQLSGGALTAEGTTATRIADSATMRATSLTLGAGKIAIGQVDQKTAGANTLVLNPALLQQVSGVANLTLRSFNGLDAYGQASLGGDATRSLTLDTANIRMASADAVASVKAGGVTLVNTTGVAAEAVQAGTGTFKVEATGAAGGSGNVTIGPGRATADTGTDSAIDAAINNRSVAVSGVQGTVLKASGSVVLAQGASKFASSGNTAIEARSLTAQTGAEVKLSTTGDWSLSSPAPGAGVVTAASAGVGAHVSVEAATIKQAGTIALTSGELKLTSSATGLGAGGSQGIQFADGSLTDLSGQAKTFDGVGVYTTGGTLTAQALQGHIGLDKQATINVSAPAGGGNAGSVNLVAQQGAVVLDGRLLGTAQAGGTSGSLSIDSKQAVDAAKLSSSLLADQTATLNNFREALSLRNRSGGQTIEAGTTLNANHIAITADAGSLTVAGTLNADGKAGGVITLASAGKLTLQSGGVLSANATGANQDGGQINLSSSNEAVGGVSSGGIALQSGARISTQAKGSGAAGELNLRSARTADGKDVLIDKIESQLTGVGRIEVEAVKNYSATTITGALINTINTDNATLAGTGNANVASVKARLAAGNATVSDALHVRAGVEVRSTGNLTLANTFKSADNKITLTGWNLGLDGNGNSATLVGGEPMNLTLRAAGNLLVQGTLSDGFSSNATNALITRDGATLRLVGGADLKSADVMAVTPSSTAGDVTIGAGTSAKPLDVLVRTTTGDIQVAAGRDVELLNRSAVVYTTGKPVDTSTLTGYGAVTGVNDAYLAQSPFLTGAGNVTVSAARDVKQSATTTAQSAVDWLWRQRGTSAVSTAWYSRYDYFKQGFGSFGGGLAQVTAGRDASKVEVVAPASGYYSTADKTLHEFGGGDVSLAAGRDVKGGYVMTVGDHDVAVQAGRDVALGSSSADSGLQALYGNGATTIEARNNAKVGVVGTYGLNKWAKQGVTNAVGAAYIDGLASSATLLVQADAGDLGYAASYSAPAGSYKSTQQTVVPDEAIMATPNGSATLGTIIQSPTGEANLGIFAQGDITAANVWIAGSGLGSALPSWSTPNIGYMNADDESGELNPVRIVSSKGSVVVKGPVVVAKPLRVIAAKDVIAKDTSGFSSQHHLATDLTLIQAGRDVLLGQSTGTGVDVHGPGDVIVSAGRNVSLGISSGILAKGNRENALLPSGSADVTVLAGVDLAGAAYEQALRDDSALAQLVRNDSAYGQLLRSFLTARGAATEGQILDADQAWLALQALPKEQQLLFVNQALIGQVRAAGREAAALSGAEREAAYAKAYAAIESIFPVAATASGSIDMGSSAIKTNQDSAIVTLAPYGGLNVGQLTSDAGASSASLGLVTANGGSISALVRDNVAVNQSRVFTVSQGDLLIWSSTGNIDAGKGAKTVASAPAPLYRLDPNGNVQVDTSGSFSGSGIAVLSKDSALDLYAPKGEINAGDAGIQSKGSAFFGAQRFVGADNLQVGGPTVGAPKPPTMDAVPVAAPRLNTDSPRAGNDADQEDAKRKRRRNLLLDFLGAGDDSAKP